MKKWGRGVGLVLIFLCVALRAPGQGGATGAITGALQDKSGREVTGAKVTALNESTKEVLRTEVTDSSGLFTMTLLPAADHHRHQQLSEYPGEFRAAHDHGRNSALGPIRPALFLLTSLPHCTIGAQHCCSPTTQPHDQRLGGQR